MHTEHIKKSINTIASLTEDEWDIVSRFLEEKTLSKNDFLLKEGEVCNFISFVNSGTLVYYRLSKTGAEITTDFAFAGDWATDNRSRLNNSPSQLNIKAIEKTELLVILNNNLLSCYNQIPRTERIGRILIEQAFVKIAQQSIDLQTLSASERYNKMLHSYPGIFQKVPLYHIANYLGIAPKSLSRIRKENVKK
jgi:CRP-like cAMP-binding protein